jgi:plasmid stabilization system protein ParE
VRHDVVWSQDAYRSLQEIWNKAVNKENIDNAIDDIQATLAENAHEKGESRPDGSRIYFASPLAIAYLANDRTTEVEIRAVWAIRRT